MHAIRQGGPTLCVAVDAEFLRTHGDLYCRAVSFCPFVSWRGGERPSLRRRPEVIPPTNGEKCFAPRQLLRRTVVLDPTAVMQHCDVLPCGDALHPLVKRLDLAPLLPFVSFPKSPRASGLDESSDAFELEKLPCAPVSPRQGEDRLLGTDHEGLFLDPYSIPNYARLSSFVDEYLRCAPSTDVLSLDTSCVEWNLARKAANLRNQLLPYGKGRPSRPAFGALLQSNSSEFRRQLLVQLGGSEGVATWLQECASCAMHMQKDTLERILPRCGTSRDASLSTTPAGNSSAADSSSLCDEVTVCDSFFSFAVALSRLTLEYHSDEFLARQTLLHHRPRSQPTFTGGPPAAPGGGAAGVHFFAYSGSDDVAVNNTLRLVDAHVTLTDVCKMRQFKDCGLWRKPDGRPFVPSLVRCLSDLAAEGRSEAAAALIAEPDNHNPAWDAAGLAAVADYFFSQDFAD